MTSTTPSPPPPRWGTPREFADRTGVSPKTVRRWIASGALPGYRLGPARLRVDLNDLDAMILQRVEVATPQDPA